jgi:hypothetical protein
MRGELLPVWYETWREIWVKIAKYPNAPDDIFSELYREFTQAFTTPPTPEACKIACNNDPLKGCFRVQ